MDRVAGKLSKICFSSSSIGESDLRIFSFRNGKRNSTRPLSGLSNLAFPDLDFLIIAKRSFFQIDLLSQSVFEFRNEVGNLKYSFLEFSRLSPGLAK